MRGAPTEVYRLFEQMTGAGVAYGQFVVSGPDDIASAVRHFFSAEAQAAAAATEPRGAAP